MLGLTEIKGVSVPAREVGGDFFNYFQAARRPHRPARRRRVGQGRRRGPADGESAGGTADATRARPGSRLARAGARRRHRPDDARPGLRDAVRRHPRPGDTPPALRERRPQSAGATSCAPTVDWSGWSRRAGGIGLLSGGDYAEQAFEVAAGDVLFFYTDGCVEAENASGDMFESERLEQALASAAGLGDNQVMAKVEAEVSTLPRRRGAAGRRDDDGRQGRLTSGQTPKRQQRAQARLPQVQPAPEHREPRRSETACGSGADCRRGRAWQSRRRDIPVMTTAPNTAVCGTRYSTRQTSSMAPITATVCSG